MGGGYSEERGGSGAASKLKISDPKRKLVRITQKKVEKKGENGVIVAIVYCR